ncbi:hypothetical protein RF11_06357 [Thelohanellus kitauei]|uniref:MULE transposase domain-containing protein n=1 Tax=Thelohanellus kitauei TaxID=669202 RepID=A0A0C2J8L9_THEKT|nr:hypothetical protein RF11_06357 [Thelohanellus kitauei]
MPCIIKCDVEWALINGIKHGFPDRRLHRCYFRMSRFILKKKIKRCQVNDKNKKVILEHIETMRLISTNKLENRVNFIRTQTNNYNPNLNKLWAYFTNTWTKRFDHSIWSQYVTSTKELVNQTNNVLE